MLNDKKHAGIVRFGPFEWDPDRLELSKNGHRVRLSGQPLDVLLLLLERADRLVSRDDLRERLWSTGTLIDFEQGLNTAVARLRTALGDSAEHPRYVATVPGRGYRFIAPITTSGTFEGRLQGTVATWVNRRTWVVGGLGLAIGAAGSYLIFGQGSVRTPALARRFVVSGPPGPMPDSTGAFRNLAISPDGRRVVYRASAGGTGRLYVRELDSVDSVEGRWLPVSDAFGPFFSPDGLDVGFYQFASRALMRTSVLGGTAMITQLSGFPAGADWGKDDRIVFATDDASEGIQRVSAAGGEPEPLTEPDPGRNHVLPALLPNGRGLLFVDTPHTPTESAAEIRLLDLSTGRHERLVEGSHPQYATAGFLIYLLDGRLMAVPLDPDTGTLGGDPFVAFEGLTHSLGPAGGPLAQYALAEDGSLVFASGPSPQARQLVWVDREGREEPLPIPPEDYVYPRISPDGMRVALTTSGPGPMLLYDFARSSLSVIESSLEGGIYPVWTDGGDRLIFSVASPAQRGVYRKDIDSGAPAELLLATSELSAPYFVAPAGNGLVLAQQTAAGIRLRSVPLTGEGGSVELIADARNAALSPDGSMMAYQTDESGQFEIFLRSFPDLERRQLQVSTAGGVQPAWSPDGHELFYVQPGMPASLMAVEIEGTPSFRPAQPRHLTDWPYYVGELGRTYDVSRDGRSLLAIKHVVGSNVAGNPPPQVEIVLDWAERLRDLGS